MSSKYKIRLYWFLCCLALPSMVLAEKQTAVEKLTPTESVIPMLLGLAGILLLIFFLAILIKKVTGLNIVSNSITVLESQSLGAKEKLVIVEIQKQQYVLGVTAHSINKICQLQEKIEKKKTVMSFDKVMQQFLQPIKTTKIRAESALDADNKKANCEVK